MIYLNYLKKSDLNLLYLSPILAVTIVEAGIKANVIPRKARALVNHRIHPADDIDDVVAYDNTAIDDSRVKVTLLPGSFSATKVSPYNSDFMPFRIIVNSAYEVHPTAHVTPGIMVANTDTKHYQHLTDAIYRFQPVLLGKSDISRFHGIDERIGVQNYIQVYFVLFTLLYLYVLTEIS